MGRAVYISKDVSEKIRHIDDLLGAIPVKSLSDQLIVGLLTAVRLEVRRLRAMVEKKSQYRSPKKS